MEVSKEMKEDISKSQFELKKSIRGHQALVARLKGNEKNETIKSKIKEAEKRIIGLVKSQRDVFDRLRREIEFYRTKMHRNNIPLEEDFAYVGRQLKEYQAQNKKRKVSISLLKDSVLNEIKSKSDESAKTPKRPSLDEQPNVSRLKQETLLNISLRKEVSIVPMSYQQLDMESTPPQLPVTLNIMENKRANFVNTLNKVKKRMCSDLESVSVTVVPVQTSLPQQSSRGMSVEPIEGTAISARQTPTPSPPLLPRLPGPGETLDKDGFLRHCDLVTHQQCEEIQRKRSERKKRTTTSTNKTEFVYGGFEKRRKYNQFPYLQQHTPPQTRAKERLKRERRLQRLQHASEVSPNRSDSAPPSPTARTSDTPAWIASLPSGLTVQPLNGKIAKKTCISCKNDFPMPLFCCSNCDSHFHMDCAKANSSEGDLGSRACPSCEEDIPDSQPVTLTPVPSTSAKLNGATDEEFLKLKEAERASLIRRNAQLQEELRRLEARSSSIESQLSSNNENKADLFEKHVNLRQQVMKLMDFVHMFKKTSSKPMKLTLSESDSSDNMPECVYKILCMLLTVEEFIRLEPFLGVESGHAYHKNALSSELNERVKFQLRRIRGGGSNSACLQAEFDLNR